MSSLLVVISVIFLLGLCGSAAVFLLFRNRSTASAPSQPPAAAPSAEPAAAAATSRPARFRWRQAGLPVAVLLVSLALVAYFAPLLPDPVAYRFAADGTPQEWAGRGSVILWTVFPQAFLTMVAVGITWGASRLSTLFQGSSVSGLPVQRAIAVMGNMVAIPQVILAFAMADVFSYNAYRTHLIPVWLFALVVMVAGAVFLGSFFIRAFRQVSGR